MMLNYNERLIKLICAQIKAGNKLAIIEILDQSGFDVKHDFKLVEKILAELYMEVAWFRVTEPMIFFMTSLYEQYGKAGANRIILGSFGLHDYKLNEDTDRDVLNTTHIFKLENIPLDIYSELHFWQLVKHDYVPKVHHYFERGWWKEGQYSRGDLMTLIGQAETYFNPAKCRVYLANRLIYDFNKHKKE